MAIRRCHIQLRERHSGGRRGGGGRSKRLARQSTSRTQGLRRWSQNLLLHLRQISPQRLGHTRRTRDLEMATRRIKHAIASKHTTKLLMCNRRTTQVRDIADAQLTLQLLRGTGEKGEVDLHRSSRHRSSKLLLDIFVTLRKFDELDRKERLLTREGRR